MARLTTVNALLAEWSKGNEAARDELIPLVYDELRRLARSHMAQERAGHSLQATALVNEVYVRLTGRVEVQWQDRIHFFAVASLIMRRILVDYARRRRYSKRGGDVQRVSLDEAMIVSKDKAPEIVALDEALTRLAEIDPRKSQIVEMKYFGGLTIEEISAVLEISPVTVGRDWSTAKAWLYRALDGATDSNGR